MEIERKEIVCSKGSRIKISDYSTERDFDKKYKISLINECQEVLFATNISQVEMNFEFMFKDYQAEIRRVESERDAYKKIINDFLSKIDVQYKKEDEKNENNCVE